MKLSITMVVSVLGFMASSAISLPVGTSIASRAVESTDGRGAYNKERDVESTDGKGAYNKERDVLDIPRTVESTDGRGSGYNHRERDTESTEGRGSGYNHRERDVESTDGRGAYNREQDTVISQ